MRTAKTGPDFRLIRYIAENVAPRAASFKKLKKCQLKTRKSQDCGNAFTQITGRTIREADYKAIRNELTVLGKLVLRGARLVTPRKHRKQVSDLAHEGHRGIAKTKTETSNYIIVRWPDIDRQVEQRCRTCQQVATTRANEKD